MAPQTALGKVCRVTVKLVRFLLSANIEQYFLYNGLLYLALGVLALLSEDFVHKFLCAKPARSEEGGIGCLKCPDKLLLCGKPVPDGECWRMAMNITYLNDGLLNDGYYKYRLESSLDTECNRIVEAAKSPISMLEAIQAEQASSGGSVPSKDCVRFHCKILLNALQPLKSGDLASRRAGVGASCSNVYQQKWFGDPGRCPCQNQIQRMNLDRASSFRTTCGPMADELADTVFYTRMLLNSKEECYAENIRMYFEEVDPKLDYMRRSFAKPNCSYLTQEANTVQGWFKRKEEETERASKATATTRFAVPTSCINDYCKIFNRTLYSDLCDWSKEDLLVRMTAASLQHVQNNCPSFDYSPAAVCAIVGPGPVVCQPFTTQASTTLGIGGAAARLLTEDENQTRSCKADSCSRTASQNIIKGQGLVVARQLQEDAAATDTGSGGGTSSGGSAAATSMNDALQDYIVSDWSKCVCMHQCIEGVKSRGVSCPAGMQCKEPKPAASERCICGHCADCQIEPYIKALEFTYWGMGGSCLLLSLGFFSISSITEDDLTDMGIGMKLLGCFCKIVPVCIRIGVYVALVLVLVLDFSVMPGTGFMLDCPHSQNMVVLSLVISVTWVLQLVAGIVVKKRRQVPPWMYNSVKDGIVSKLLVPLRAIGP